MRMTHKNTLYGTAAATLTLAIFALVAFPYGQSEELAGSQRSKLPNRTTLTNDGLDSLTWSDLLRGDVFRADSQEHLNLIFHSTMSIDNPPAIYLRGLWLLSQGKPAEALGSFKKLCVDSTPVQLLYAPYRVHQEMRPNQPNPFLRRLQDALEGEELSALTRARLLTNLGRLSDALATYLQTNPAEWARHDLACMRKMMRHSGLESEVARMLLAAVSAGNLRKDLTTDFSQLAFQRSQFADTTSIQDQLRQTFSNDKDLASFASAAIVEMQESRKLFLDRDYQALLNNFADHNPVSLTSEATLMLFLSAVHEEDRPAVSRWGQELKRRYPSSEVIQWVDTLTNPPTQKS